MTDTAEAPSIIERAQATLRANDRGGYTVPTDRLYPFQWNWDSAFVAMGWATFDVPRAWDEIRLLLRGQWTDGLIPQIIFHAPSDDYFPGPDVWQTNHMPPTSGIPQPPILATAIRAVLAAAPDRKDEIADIYPRLVANHRWWHAARDPEGTGLVATLHPWESGMDNSPAWDAAMARVPTTTTTTIRRRDTSHIDPAMRPQAEDYQRFIHLVDLFRETGWNPSAMYAASPFRMADIGTNAILLRAEQDLLALCANHGTRAEAAEISERILRMKTALADLWDPKRGIYVSRDLVTDAHVDVATSAGFLPLYAGIDTHAADLSATLEMWHAHVSWLVPSTDPTDRRFEPMRYWRGPVWAVVNWMIADGFSKTGQPGKAATIIEATRTLIDQTGLSEYFDPTTGVGLGGETFSWTAAIRLLIEAQLGGPIATEPKMQFGQNKTDQASFRMAEVQRTSFG